MAWLGREERSKGTREKYQRDLTEFRTWLHGACVDKERVAQWKHQLLEQGYAPVTVNSKLADVLGHSSIETTRIYLIASETQHAKYLDGLGFVS